MINKVTIKNFKRFESETFDLSDRVVLAGPNNSGKTTLLQALAIWNFALLKWVQERGDSLASQRSGVTVSRSQLTVIPLREMNHLWWNASTALRSAELKGKPLGTPRVIEIEVEGEEAGRSWAVTVEVRYASTEQIYIKLSENSKGNLQHIIEKTEDGRFKPRVNIVHVPPFSGIGVNETGYDQGYKDMLIGQGKPGDVIRNLLLEVQAAGKETWNFLKNDIIEIFNYELIEPIYAGPFIKCEYRTTADKKLKNTTPVLDIASAGSGFHQVLTLLAFFYARPASVLLLDEPDAHQHIVLQKQVFDRLRLIAEKRNCQLIIASHSEVLIDGTSPDSILSFFGKPHLLVEKVDRDQVVEALKKVRATEMLLAERSNGVLYLEGESDFNLLKAWADILNHPIKGWFHENPFWRSNEGRHPRESKSHYFAIRAIRPEIKGLLLLDGDNRVVPSHEIDAEGLIILRWERYESESYLLHPNLLNRFISVRALPIFAHKAVEYLSSQLPPVLMTDPFQNPAFIKAEPVSKTILPEFIRISEIRLRKNEYYLIASEMDVTEIHPEIVEKLDLIYDVVK